ncbi:DUF4931 domain-containing protein [Candidatus Falkowbacteria bacterium]|nr:DUF4931 domain-containing protein [Candidatus Falkowbacteria bacterium]
MPKERSEIRKSYLLDKYVVITPGRAKRPRDVKEQTILKRSGKCPFCSENIDKNNIKDRINDKNGDWQVLSVANIFPAVSLDNKKAYGTQEVVIDTPNHQKELADLSIGHIQKLLEMYSKRTTELTKNKNLDYILCFKNQGSKAGASIIHAHSQIFATKMIPKELEEEAYLLSKYKMKHKTCAYCDILAKEEKGKRKIYSDENVVAFTPYASEYHYEAWIFPRRHLDNITEMNKEELASFSQALKLILKKLKSIDLSFNYFLHNVVSNKEQHFYLKIQPRDSIWAGVELASGLVINSVSPEKAADFYRQ